MWWSRAAIAGALLVGLALAGCQVRPLYAPAGGGGPGPQADLSAIFIEEPETREEQVYRNALIFAFRGGGAEGAARYRLLFRMTMREQEIAVERGTGVPNAYQLTGSVSFLVKEIASDRSVFGSSVTAMDSYTRSSQLFANIRARRDAEDRLANALAELTTARLSAYFATH
jgi:LPS-assembly lipoprotein